MDRPGPCAALTVAPSFKAGAAPDQDAASLRIVYMNSFVECSMASLIPQRQVKLDVNETLEHIMISFRHGRENVFLVHSGSCTRR
jgi:hypothetical protein